MGFFEDTKPPEPLPVVQEVKQDWLAVLVWGIFAILTTLLIFTLRGVAFVAKPTFAYLFTFEGRTRQQITQQMGFVAAIIIIPLFFLYRVPFIRDGLTLSRTHTVNHSANGQRIHFPDRSFFVPTDRRMALVLNGKTYITYAGYSERVMQKMNSDECQAVTRSEKMGLASLNPPLQAEGFKDEVSYEVEQPLSDLNGWRYIRHLMARPNVWFKPESVKRGIMVKYDETSPWKQFVDNWRDVYAPPNFGGYKVYAVKALSSEHALACF